MFTNLRTASFAVLSGALMIAGSSMAFANPDQTNPRENALSAPCSSASGVTCETVSQDAYVTPNASDSSATQPVIESGHDNRRNRSHQANR